MPDGATGSMVRQEMEQRSNEAKRKALAQASAGSVLTAKAGSVVEGVVEHGRRLGRELGFPTANLDVAADLPLTDGVYRSRMTIEGRTYDGMSNLGCNPSVGGAERRLETHIFDFTGNLYGRQLRVELLEKIRDERRFATVEELRAQIARDRERIRQLIAAEHGDKR